MTRRSLILAGGAMKVAFQAGVLQVWLDEADLSFDHVDGASGGVFNLAMMCQGKSGKEIADAWRRTEPLAAATINAAEIAKLAWAKSLLTQDGLKDGLFKGWDLDFDKIRASALQASFNAYNFSRHELAVWGAADMDADRLAACVALPMWFPPVVMDGETFIDAVYVTDANLEEAIRHGADELWVIWTVSESGVWEDGFVANYFQIIESAANGNFRRTVARIEANNAAISRGDHGEFGRPITLKILRAEVPIHYLIGFSKDRLHEVVNMGVDRARAWCLEQGIPLKRITGEYPDEVHEALTTLEFTETMRGYASRNETDFNAGYARGKRDGERVTFQVTIDIQGVNRFVTSPRHEASITGWVEADVLGGRCKIHSGAFNLLVDSENTRHKAMYYRLWFDDSEGRPRTLFGYKDVKDDMGLDVWEDTTTLHVKFYEGHVSERDTSNAQQVVCGIMKLEMMDFLKELTTFRVTGPTLADRTGALNRFGRLFMGKLWDVYAGHILTYSPL